ncbi:MAG TPA: Re/Si-specific NAD(P)(+) transhydrogenase subunit alpha [Myxococcaceae bacterium]|nr:Re/Si-specific NAD(P)(+) transhydrogenase subunit alpha [Myxococcaceae bacterium]
MRIGVPKETANGETRVALIPDSVARLVKAGLEVVVEKGAGARAHFVDAAYLNAGATLVDTPAAAFGADVVVKVSKPSMAEADLIRSGTLLVSLLSPSTSLDVLQRLSQRKVTALSLERVPRITRAQSMDVLSSQSTVAGYKSVLLGASQLGRFLPMLTTAAGSIAPARVFILGAGVAGLQAIATARRLGAVVSAFDVRAAAKEQVLSLGATFVATDLVSQAAEDKGGYAKAQTDDQQRATAAALEKHLKDVDLAICTAQIPGKPAPKLITEAMVAGMKTGSVIVDLAAETGGNCAVTQPGKTVDVNGVWVLGPMNIASTVPFHASQMFSKNVLTLLQHMTQEGKVVLNLEDEIVKAMAVTHEGTPLNV